MTTKVCTKCGLEKSLTEFHRDKSIKIGYRARCKQCCIIAGKKYNASPKGKEARRKYLDQDTVKEARREYQKTDKVREVRRKGQQRRRQTEAGKEVGRRYRSGTGKQWRQEMLSTKTGRLKIKARNAITYGLKKGTVIKKPCEECGNKNSQGHHPDYNKPLEVIWLCPLCHAKEHQKKVV